MFNMDLRLEFLDQFATAARIGFFRFSENAENVFFLNTLITEMISSAE